MKPFSEAAERNRGPILDVLKRVLVRSRLVLEIGAGTGQHAAHLAANLAHLAWQPTDVAEHLPGIRMWTDGIPNVRPPLALDVDGPWPAVPADAAYSANTCHIMSWAQVERLFQGLAGMAELKVFCLYGPFSYGGRHTSPSNESFDAMLRARDPLSGVRDAQAIAGLAGAAGLGLAEDNPMPANNRLLVFRRDGD
jgi:SAM-dependent methyltransferase